MHAWRQGQTLGHSQHHSRKEHAKWCILVMLARLLHSTIATDVPAFMPAVILCGIQPSQELLWLSYSCHACFSTMHDSLSPCMHDRLEKDPFLLVPAYAIVCQMCACANMPWPSVLLLCSMEGALHFSLCFYCSFCRSARKERRHENTAT